MWFPRPTHPEDLIVRLGADELGDEALVDRLSDPEATEWRDKVGVVGSAEGSAKPTTRLLWSRGWVFKTDVAHASRWPWAAIASVRELARTARRLPLWHPRKGWIVIRSGGLYYPVTACPELQVVRRLEGFAARVEAWGRMLRIALSASDEHGVGLDVHPSNFGFDGDELYYLDDELFPKPHELRGLGEFLASRLPEEPDADERAWAEAGRSLAVGISSQVRDVSRWRELEDGLADYPLVERYEVRRSALSRGIRRVAHPRRSRRRDSEPHLTCVFADVHANHPALEAVLRAARAFGADSHLFLGDLVGYGPHPRECVATLSELESLVAIRGNHDHAALAAQPHDGMNRPAREATDWTARQLGERERRWLASLPREAAGPGWLAVHGAPRDPERFYAYVYELTYRENLEVLAQEEIQACFYGHTHVQFVHRRSPEDTAEKLGVADVELGAARSHLLLNPGSVGQPRDGDTRAAFAMWDRESNAVTFHRADYLLEKTLRDLALAGLPEDLARRLEVGR